MDPKPYIRQLKAGRDFAVADPIAAQMANFVYLVGDRATGKCLVVDPAWDVQGIVAAAEADEMQIEGALVTHYHPDHVGGPLYGHRVDGLDVLQEICPCKVHVHKEEAAGVMMMTGLSEGDLVRHDSGDRVQVGGIDVELLHTPGHTPGSQCFRCGSALISGDTLFLQGCGRVDLPGGDTEEMYYTLTQRLSKLPDDLTLFPGHDYGSKPFAALSEVRQTNAYLQVPDLDTWRRYMG